MTISLNASQIELNCRRLHKFDISVLVSDENGSLYRESKWYDFIFFFRRDYSIKGIGNNIPSGSYRHIQVSHSIKATLEGMIADMKKEVPISFFIIPDTYNSYCSYASLAHRVKWVFIGNSEIKELAEEVTRLSDSLDYKLKLPSRLNFDQVAAVNRYVTKNMKSTFQGSCSLTRKEEHAKFVISTIQQGIDKNQIWDSCTGKNQDLAWVASGEWEDLYL